MPSAAIVGSTGLVGGHILSTLLSLPSITTIESITRRSPPQASTPQSKLTTFIDTDTSKWAPHLSALKPAPDVFFSSLATTRANAGGLENQHKLEHGVNVELAKAAKDAGVKVYVCISSNGANAKSMIPYSKMKGEIEDDVKALGFEHTVILRPGLIVGERQESRPAEALARGVANLFGKVHAAYLKDGWAQDADVIAKAAVNAAVQCAEGKVPDKKVWVLNQSDIIRLGRTEWTGTA